MTHTLTNTRVAKFNAMVRVLFTTSDTLEHFFPFITFVFFTDIEGLRIQIYSHIRKHISQKYFKRVVC